MSHRFALALVVALVPLACGGPTAAPSAVSTEATIVGTALFVPGPNSCPHDPPLGWRAIAGAESVEFRWAPVPGAVLYQVEVVQRETGILAARFLTEHFSEITRRYAGGRYLARIRTWVCGGDGQSVWSPWEEFAIGSSETPNGDTSPTPTPTPPTPVPPSPTPPPDPPTPPGPPDGEDDDEDDDEPPCPVELPEQARPDCPPGHGGTPPGQE